LLPADANATDVLDAFEGLLLIGGSDVDPCFYGAEAHSTTTWVDSERDRAELALTRLALDHDIPLLAICRGIEVLNVAQGGTLVQHLPDAVGHRGHLERDGAFSHHEVSLTDPAPGGVTSRREVASYHHQGIERLGAELRPFAWADDGVIEAIRHTGASHAVGVLWHPEVGADRDLFVSFVDAAREHQDRTVGPR
jgi:gamma-glutamyl-gamma-aminobutyrate hydrolase PuuD